MSQPVTPPQRSASPRSATTSPATRSSIFVVTARLDERIFQPLRVNTFARRTWFAVTIAVIVGVYGGLLAWMLYRDAMDPPRSAQAQETPVEIVAELPKPPQPATPEPPAPKQPAEKPATSAPRAFNDSKVETDSADKDSHAPKTPDKPASPAQAASRETAEAPPSPTDTAHQTAEAPKPELSDKEAEALDKAPPEPPKKPATIVKAAPSPPKPRVVKSVAQQLEGASDLPDFTFAKPTRKRSKVSGGTEDDRYLAVVYGLITQNPRAVSYPYGDWSVAVSFMVDGGGNLVGVEVSHSSGIREVDAQAIEAVESAAPFPPPPSGGNTGLVARLRSGGAAQAYAGER